MRFFYAAVLKSANAGSRKRGRRRFFFIPLSMLSAGGETVPYRFSFVGRPLPVVRGKTGEYGRLSAGGKTVPYSYCFVGRPLPVLRGKTGEEYRLSASGETLSCRFCFVGRPLPVFACQQKLQGVRQCFPISHLLDKIIDTACIR